MQAMPRPGPAPRPATPSRTSRVSADRCRHRTAPTCADESRARVRQPEAGGPRAPEREIVCAPCRRRGFAPTCPGSCPGGGKRGGDESMKLPYKFFHAGELGGSWPGRRSTPPRLAPPVSGTPRTLRGYSDSQPGATVEPETRPARR